MENRRGQVELWIWRRKEGAQADQWGMVIMKNNVTPGQTQWMSLCSVQKKSKKVPFLSSANTHTHTHTYWIWSSSVLGYDAVWSGRHLPKFKTMYFLLLAWHTLQTQISETPVNFYQTTKCHNPEDSNLHIYLEFDILTEVVMKSSVFWIITPSSPLKDGGNMSVEFQRTTWCYGGHTVG
jgi:hypothetical protein